MKKLLFIVLVAITSFATAQQMQQLPIDPNVRKGVLENGLTYYIRQNNMPENRVDFYIAQKVGSMQEEDNQAGLAHFLEHMAFNGTTHFPKKTMLEYLQDNGIKFGTNINAYTSFDQTVYYISDVPSTNKNLVDSCIMVLFDWSSGIALEEEELDNERGVIREEWRTRGGAQQRILEKLLPGIYKDSKYANRMPIGSIDVINNFKPEEIRSYYQKWYRPDLQGIIIVGDVDVDATENRLIELFSTIKLDPNRAERVYYPVPDLNEPIATVATDPEGRNTEIMLFYKHDPIPTELKNTQVHYLNSYVKNIASEMQNQRFSEISQKPNSPFTFAYTYDDDFVVAKTKDAYTIAAASAEDKIIDALAAMVRETERIRRHGFTAAEYERARVNVLKRYEDSYNNRDKQRNSAYANEYVSSFIDDEPIPGIEYEYQMMQAMAPMIPVEIINKAMSELDKSNIVIAVSGPEKEGLVYPTEQELIDVLVRVEAETIEPYVDELSDEPLIETPPTPGSIVETTTDEVLDATVWRLSNGVTVVLKNTDFKDDEIIMSAQSYGGTSQYAEQDPINANVMGQVMTLGGVGKFSSTDLPKILAGKNASARPGISLTNMSFSGSSSIKDFETMLQLVYLYFTSPRADKEAFQSYLQRTEIQLRNAEAEPMVAFSDSIRFGMYDNNPMVKRMKVEDLEKIDYDRIMTMYKQIFSNPGSFVFTFVGNIDLDAVKPAILQYLGSIKGQYAKNVFKHVPMDVRTGKYSNEFKREMKTPKAAVFNAFSGNVERNLRNNILMSMFDQILDIVYIETVREEEGGTYGVSSSGSISRYPDGQTILQISFDTDPEKMAHLNKIVHDELYKIAAEGPRSGDFSKVKEYMLKRYSESQKENGYWMSQLVSKHFYGEDMYSEYLNIVNSVTGDDIKQFAKMLLSQGNEVVVVMLPEATAAE